MQKKVEGLSAVLICAGAFPPLLGRQRRRHPDMLKQLPRQELLREREGRRRRADLPLPV
jgi:hypothetical protein